MGLALVGEALTGVGPMGQREKAPLFVSSHGASSPVGIGHLTAT